MQFIQPEGVTAVAPNAFAPAQTDQSGSGQLPKSLKLYKLYSKIKKNKNKGNTGTELTREFI